MKNLKERPILSYDEQIEHLKERGITFNKNFSENEAKEYLRSHNNLFRVTSYRENFKDRNPNNKSKKYNGLDFSHLVDLSRIDMRLRRIIFNLSSNIEHYSKLQLLNSITESSNENRDSHKIVKDFINSLEDREANRLQGEIERNARNIYLSGLYREYHEKFPIWAFLEIISFGQFIYLYKFYTNNYDCKLKKDDFYLLEKVKRARNAAAHNNCFINDLHPGKKPCKDEEVMTALAKIGIKEGQRRKKMSNERIAQIITCLYMHQKIVTHHEHTEIHLRISRKLQALSTRFFENFKYESNDVIRTTFHMMKEIIDHWYTIT
ncbi:MAG: Abi family protein [Acetobacter sp.]|nr:Abi family protein [Acetobacter sp.]